MFNNVRISNLDLWKYVDDSTMSEVLMKNELSSMQAHVDQFMMQTKTDGLELNESKCKELRITFSKAASIMDDKDIEIVSSAKLLGVIVSDNLKWNAHINMICKKVATRLYFLPDNLNEQNYQVMIFCIIRKPRIPQCSTTIPIGRSGKTTKACIAHGISRSLLFPGP